MDSVYDRGRGPLAHRPRLCDIAVLFGGIVYTIRVGYSTRTKCHPDSLPQDKVSGRIEYTLYGNTLYLNTGTTGAARSENRTASILSARWNRLNSCSTSSLYVMVQVWASKTEVRYLVSLLSMLLLPPVVPSSP